MAKKFYVVWKGRQPGYESSEATAGKAETPVRDEPTASQPVYSIEYVACDGISEVSAVLLAQRGEASMFHLQKREQKRDGAYGVGDAT